MFSSWPSWVFLPVLLTNTEVRTWAFYEKSFSLRATSILVFTLVEIFRHFWTSFLRSIYSRVKFNFAHVSQSLTFFDQSCQDLWVEVKVETHLVGTHRVFLISEIFMFSRSWRTRSSSLHFWKSTICQLSTLSVNCEQKRSYDRLKSASFWWWKKSSYFRTKLFSEL